MAVTAAIGARLGDVELVDELIAVVGAAQVLIDPDVTAGARTDWTGRFGGAAALVVRPADPREVAAVLGIAARRGTPVVPQGGNTGLVGGSVPTEDGSIVLSTARLHRLDAPDVDRGTVVVGAGVTPSELSSHLDSSGWRFAVDLGARDSATIGGMVATNAGGMRVFRFGSMRRQVVGIEYVTAGGDVVSHLGGLEKDNTGLDLAGLLCGSEGTLAVVTAVCLRLVPDPPGRATALLGFADAASARRAGWELRRHAPSIEVVEYVSGSCLDLVVAVSGTARPVASPEVLLVEAAGDVDVEAGLASSVASLSAPPLDVAVATSAARRSELWRCRDDVSAAISTLGPVVKYDVSVPAVDVDAFRRDVDAVVAARAPGARGWWFGHVCDDNLHLNVTGVGEESADLDRAVLSLVAAHGGSISAEHGIGRVKAPYLHLVRSDAEVALMAAVKRAFDPAGILNPGVLFSP